MMYGTAIAGFNTSALKGFSCVQYSTRTAISPRSPRAKRIYQPTRHSSITAQHQAPKVYSENQSLPPNDLDSNTDFRASKISCLLLSFCIGAVGSSVGSLIGAGGAVVITPLLTTWGLSQHAAHGTSLCVVTVTAAISSLRYASANELNKYAALALTSGAILTASFGARSASKMNARKLKRVFGAFLMFISLAIPSLPFLLSRSSLFSFSQLQTNFILILVGLISGFLTGLLGIGGGTINVPALVLLAGFTQKVAQGSALLAMLVPSVLGSATHMKQNNVRIILLPGLITGAVFGAFMGSGLALYMHDGTLRVICSIIFAAIGLKYLLTPRRKLT